MEQLMGIEAIIFDLDGVIVHTDRYHYSAWKELADRLGIYFNEQINNRLRGVSRMESLEIILERSKKIYSEAEKDAFAKEKNDRYRALLGNMSPSDVSDGVRDTLVRLKRIGLKLAIGSSSKNAGYILERVGLADFFDVVIDGNDITHSKPHPEVFLTAAKRLNLSPQSCAVVEDAESGIDAAIAGNFTPIAIGDARRCEKAALSVGALSEILHVFQ